MTWWRFTSAAACDAAQAAATALLPHDTLVDGAVAPDQVTVRWAIPTDLTDGSIAIPPFPGMALPTGAVEASDDVVAGLTPTQDVASGDDW